MLIRLDKIFIFNVILGIISCCVSVTYAEDEVFCPALLNSEGVKIRCESPDGTEVSCSNKVEAGTKAVFTCLPYYENERESLSMKCRPNGNWFPYRTFECNIDCGRQSQILQPFAFGGTTTDTVKWPWHVAIFRASKTQKGPNDFEYICGGSIISSSTILTAAHCVTDSSKKVFPPNIYKVVLGSVSSNYTENLDYSTKAKVYSVRTVEYHPDFNAASFEADIAILQLAKRVTFDKDVRPVCYPKGHGKSLRLSGLHLSPGSTGTVVGYGLNEQRVVSHFLQEIHLPIVGTKDCAQALGRTHGHSQYCAGYTNGTSVCSGDSGGGQFFTYDSGADTRYIVQGVVSHARKGNCNSYAVFTRVGIFAEWLEQGEAKFSATVPDGSDDPDEKKPCGPVKLPPNVIAECFESSAADAESVACDKAMTDAVARFSCKDNFMEKIRESAPDEDSDITVATCMSDGKWSQVMFECEPECGLTASLKEGEDFNIRGDAIPWHVRLYFDQRRRNAATANAKPSGENFQLMCGGSLIERSFILTAASCVTDKSGGVLPIRNLRVVLGTNSSNHLTDFDSNRIQIISVKKIWIPHTFQKSDKIADIAIIQMQGPATLTRYVKRVCYLRAEFHEDIVFASWGKSTNFLDAIKNREFDSFRHSVTFSSKECNDVAMEVPSRSFCSPTKQGAVVCRNDTGHGLVFTHQLNNRLHVLKGVLSHVGSRAGDPSQCLVAVYVAYTQVEAFGAWILEIIKDAMSNGVE